MSPLPLRGSFGELVPGSYRIPLPVPLMLSRALRFLRHAISPWDRGTQHLNGAVQLGAEADINGRVLASQSPPDGSTQ